MLFFIENLILPTPKISIRRPSCIWTVFEMDSEKPSLCLNYLRRLVNISAFHFFVRFSAECLFSLDIWTPLRAFSSRHSRCFIRRVRLTVSSKFFAMGIDEIPGMILPVMTSFFLLLTETEGMMETFLARSASRVMSCKRVKNLRSSPTEHWRRVHCVGLIFPLIVPLG